MQNSDCVRVRGECPHTWPGCTSAPGRCQAAPGCTSAPSRICNKVLQDFGCRWEGAIWHNSTVFVIFWGGLMDFPHFFSVHRVPRCIGKRNVALVSLFNICKYPQRWKVPPPDKCGIVHTYPCHDTDMCGELSDWLGLQEQWSPHISVSWHG